VNEMLINFFQSLSIGIKRKEKMISWRERNKYGM
jgi:hypothetical protein